MKRNETSEFCQHHLLALRKYEGAHDTQKELLGRVGIGLLTTGSEKGYRGRELDVAVDHVKNKMS